MLVRTPRARAAAATILASFAALTLVRCGHGGDTGATVCTTMDATTSVADGAAGDAADLRCQTPPVFLTTHPHAVQQDPMSVGQNLVDTRGWSGRLYFGYGDLNLNTGPIEISSYDPVSGGWQDHLSFDTERIERFRVIGDQLWATASDPHGAADPEYAFGTAQHDWSEVSIGRSLKVLDVAERVPGDVFLFGDDLYISDAGTYDKFFGAASWRSQDGGPFERVFPILSPDPFTDVEYADLNELPFLNAAALGGTVYAGTVAPPWAFDGTQWGRSAQLGGFIHPITFAGQIVFAALGELWAFDGTHRKRLGVPLADTTLTYTFLPLEPWVATNDSEGRLLVVNDRFETLVTTDLVSWQCIGKAPPDVRSVGSLNGTVYFGGASARVYGYAAPSW